MANPTNFAPEPIPNSNLGVDLLNVYGDDSYDFVLWEESEFDGIQGVQKYLDFLMQTEAFNILKLDSDGYADPEDVRQLKLKYELSGDFGDWDWKIDYDEYSDCLVFFLWKND